MQIYIPTCGRSDFQVTWNNLPNKIKERTTLVVQLKESVKYDQYDYPLLILPPEIQSIGPTRQWLIDNSPDRFILMLDDDLDFATRRTDEPTKFLPATGEDIVNLVETIQNILHEYPMVGVSGREGANRDTSQFRYITRQLRAHGIDTEVFRREEIRFDRLPFMEDFDATLQLLELGYPNCVVNGWVHNQRGGSNAPGGCSTTRTIDAHNAAAEGLKRLHTKFVRLVEKESGNWGGARIDVYIEWKKAYESSRSRSVA